MLRGWERSIDKPLLYKILPHVEFTECNNTMIIALPSFLQSKGIEKPKKQCLLLIIKGNCIVTAYWCNCINKKLNNQRNTNFQILY
jgi:hypothetical protein